MYFQDNFKQHLLSFINDIDNIRIGQIASEWISEIEKEPYWMDYPIRTTYSTLSLEGSWFTYYAITQHNKDLLSLRQSPEELFGVYSAYFHFLRQHIKARNMTRVQKHARFRSQLELIRDSLVAQGLVFRHTDLHYRFQQLEAVHLNSHTSLSEPRPIFGSIHEEYMAYKPDVVMFLACYREYMNRHQLNAHPERWINRFEFLPVPHIQKDKQQWNVIASETALFIRYSATEGLSYCPFALYKREPFEIYSHIGRYLHNLREEQKYRPCNKVELLEFLQQCYSNLLLGLEVLRVIQNDTELHNRLIRLGEFYLNAKSDLRTVPPLTSKELTMCGCEDCVEISIHITPR